MSPNAQEVIKALGRHPELYAQVARHAALILVDEWARDPYDGGFARYLATQPRTSKSRASMVSQTDTGKWANTTGVKRFDGEYDTVEEAKTSADEALRHIGYLVIDQPFTPMRRHARFR